MDVFRAMQSFLVTVEAGSITAAAPRLGLSPAMMGQQIAALEDRLGTRLLNRTTRRQSLTEFGRSYFEEARDILNRVALAEEAAAEEQSRPRGRLRVTAPVTFGAEALAPTLAEYRDEAPEVRIDLVLTDQNVDLVEEGFDVAFRIGDIPDTRMVARPLRPYRMAICASPEYLAKRGVPRHPSEIAAHEGVAFAPSARRPWRLTRAGEQVDVTPRYGIVVNNGRAVVTAGLAGLGLIMQPEILARRELDDGRLQRLFPDWALRERPVSLIYYRDRRMTPRLRSFIAFAVRRFGEAAGPAATPG